MKQRFSASIWQEDEWFRRQLRSKSGSELPNLCYRLRRFIESKDFVPTSEKIDKISACSTPRIQHSHPRHKPTLQQLVKDVDINPTKPLN